MIGSRRSRDDNGTNPETAQGDARKGLREDLRKALDELRLEMLKQTGKLSARELEELRDFLARMRKDLKDLQGKQEQLEKDTADGADLPAVKKKQEDLDRQLEKLLARARNLLDNKRKGSKVPELEASEEKLKQFAAENKGEPAPAPTPPAPVTASYPPLEPPQR